VNAEQFKWWRCGRKVSWSSRHQALLHGRRKGGHHDVYRCSDCGGWHLTHKKPREPVS
jgi:hypothetical protein